MIYEYKNRPIEFEIIDGEIFMNSKQVCEIFDDEQGEYKWLSGSYRVEDLVILTRGNDQYLCKDNAIWFNESLGLKLTHWLSRHLNVWYINSIKQIKQQQHDTSNI